MSVTLCRQQVWKWFRAYNSCSCMKSRFIGAIDVVGVLENRIQENNGSDIRLLRPGLKLVVWD